MPVAKQSGSACYPMAPQNSMVPDVSRVGMEMRPLTLNDAEPAHSTGINPFKPEFTIVIFIHYKPRIAVAILDL